MQGSKAIADIKPRGYLYFLSTSFPLLFYSLPTSSTPSSPPPHLGRSASTVTMESTTPPSKDCLNALAPEVLLHIVSYLPFRDICALAKTNKKTYELFKEHGALICNTYIKGNLSLPADLLCANSVNGWLMPIHSLITTAESQLLARILEQCNTCKMDPDLIEKYDWDSDNLDSSAIF